MNNINETVVKVDHFKMAFGDTTIIKDLSFDIKKGETFGLVGESGSGKTTIGRAVIRIYETAGGDIFFAVAGQPKKRIQKEVDRIQDEIVLADDRFFGL